MGGGKEVSKWLHPPRRPVVFQSDGKLVTHPAEIVEQLRDSWQPIMTQERGKERMRREDMQLLLRGMPVGNATLPRLTGQMLRETANRKRPSAPGSDKISLSLLRELPLAAWEELSEVLRAIEEDEGEEWPEELRSVLLVPIPKGQETAIVAPKKARLIALTSMVFRVWSSARAAQLAEEWLPMVVGPSVLGGISGRSCKLASGWEDILWDAAEADGRPCISTFCDASKCFDNLPLEDVWELARSLGMPGEVLGPLSKWQANQERRICYENWVSERVYYDRGVVQGDPLSVSLCLLWGATWHNMLRNNLGGADFGALVYMDDFMFSVRDAHTLRKCLALTEWHFTVWRLILNLDKTAVVCNGHAKERYREELREVQVRTEESQVYLGMEASSEDRRGKALEREEAAHRRLRRMRMLPLTQMGWKRVLPSFVASLWYGMEHRPLSNSLRAWHRDIKTLVHGRARVSANWKLVQVFSLPSFSLIPECIHWSCSWSGVWRLANYESTRGMLLDLWNSRRVPRSWGLWNSFVENVSRLRGRIRPGGQILWEDCEDGPHLDWPLASWMHAFRQRGREVLFAEAAEGNRTLRPLVGRLDWEVSRKKKEQDDIMLNTLKTGGLNTKDRSHRHFASCEDGGCEHLCGEPDTPFHRHRNCIATQHLRDALGWGVERWRQADEMGGALWERNLWGLSGRNEQKPAQGSWNHLMLTPDWMQAVLAVAGRRKGQIARVYFGWGEEARGKHPSNHIRSAAVVCEDLPTLVCWDRGSHPSRRQWEVQALLLGGVLAASIKREVQVLGLVTEPVCPPS